jgi:RNA-directed DNA polymerase
MSLETPIKIRMLQRKLYQKAKGEPSYRFYLLYDKIYREDILAHAYALAKSNQGAPGVDGQSFWGIESLGLEEWLSGIRKDLRAKTYQPQAVRRVMIPKPGGGERPLGIPTIRDRVVQTAAKLLLEPILEADFDPNAYGYRPKRSAQDAIQKVHKLLCDGYADVVDADLSKYFDTIPHSELLKCVARRIVDRDMLRLIKMWLKVPVAEWDKDGKPRVSGGKGSSCGTPQGGVISPLLANLYMNRFLKYWRITGRGEVFQAQVVNYADDFVILSRGCAAEALNWTRRVMTRIGLTLNEAKTSIKRGRREWFDFLGYTFGAASASEEWPCVSRGESVEEERFPAAAESGRSAGAWQRGTVAGRARSPQQNFAGVVELLRLRNAIDGVSSGRSLRL